MVLRCFQRLVPRDAEALHSRRKLAGFRISIRIMGEEVLAEVRSNDRDLLSEPCAVTSELQPGPLFSLHAWPFYIAAPRGRAHSGFISWTNPKNQFKI